MRSRSSFPRHAKLLHLSLALLLAVGGGPGGPGVALAAQATATWASPGVNGNWNVQANWSGLAGGDTFPNNDATDTYNVVIDGMAGVGTPTAVTLNVTVTIDNLTVTANDTLAVANNQNLTIAGGAGAGAVTNNGAITLNSVGNLTNLVIGTGAGNETVTFSGTGTLTLGNNANNRILGGASTNRLVNSLGHTIQGGGQIGVNLMALTNAGLIVANQSTALTIDPSGTGAINTGTLRADGATLILTGNGTGAFDNTGGVIEAINSGVAQLQTGASITGGTLQTAGGGLIQTAANSTATLSNLTNAGTFQALNNSTTTLAGTITNTGSMTVLSAGNLTNLQLDGDVTLQGAGTLTLGNNANNRILGGASTNRLVNSLGHTIQGAGQIGVNLMALTNAGLIVANQLTALTIDPSGTGAINTGILRADGATLILTGNGGGTFTNTGATIEALAGSQVQLTAGATIIGGTLQTAGGGLIQTAANSTATLSNLTNTGTFQALNNSTTTLVGTITNTGSMTVLSIGNLTNLQLDGNVTLQGTGTLTLGNNANNRILGTASTDRLTNAANHTIQGSGNIGVNAMALTNQGTIVANQPTALTIDPSASGAINTGTLRADGGTLVLTGNSGGTFTNTSGTIEALAGSQVQLTAGATIIGGTLQTAGGGLIQTAANSTATLSNLTNAGTFQALNNSTTTLVGTITNTGSMTVLSIGNLTNLQLDGNVTLQGAGTLTLGDNANNRILGTASTDRLTNAANHTIQGSGNIGVNAMALTNQGTIVANQPTALTIDPSASGAINTGTLRADGGTLVLTGNSGGTFTNTSGTIEALAGSQVQLTAGATIIGGTLATVADGEIRVNASATATLNGVTNTGTFQALNNSTTTLVGTITNTGSMTVLSAGNLTNLQLAGDVTLQGTGTLTLGNNASNRILGTASTDRLTNAANHTIQGSGNIGVNAMALTNQGTIVANQPTNLIIDPTDSQTVLNDTTGTLRASNGATLVLQGGTFDNQGLVEARANSTVSYAATATTANNVAGTLTGGIWRADATSGASATITLRGSNITTNAADVYLVGPGSVVQVVATPIDGTLHTNNGQLRIHEGRQFTATANGGNFTNNGLVELASGAAESLVKGNTSLTNSATGVISGYGTVDNRVANTGTIQAFLGTLTVTGGMTGQGTARADGAAAVLNLSNATLPSTVKFLDLKNGGQLNLGAQNITVGGASGGDYTNDAFGVGNAFNRRANVTGSGLLLSSGTTVGQALTGANVTNGGTATPTLSLGNVRVGDSVMRDFAVQNVGTGGAADLRGAIQNTGISSGALSVTAQNWGPVAQGGTSAPFSVTFTPTQGGSLAGQTIGVVNNFDNVPGQTLGVTGAAYQAAVGQLNTATPFNFGTVQVGQSVSQTLSISNTGTGPAGFVEDLNASFGTATGTGASLIGGTGSISGLLAGATNTTSMTVSVNTSSVAAVNGSIPVNFFTAGAVNGVSNGLGTAAVGSAAFGVIGTIQANGQVVDQAQPVINNPAINLGNVRVGDLSPTQFVSVTNQATGNPQAALNASISASPPITASGSFNLLAPGGTNNTSLQVGMVTTTAGAISGTATVAFVSDASNIGNCAPNCQLTLASQNVNVTGGVYSAAAPQLATTANVANQRIGGSATSALTITNTNVAGSFQEGLDASFGANTGAATNNGGSFTNLAAGANSTALAVGVDTSTAGAKAGTATVLLTSNGTVSGLSNLALTSQVVGVSGNVYQAAVGQLNTATPFNFGTVQVGQSVSQTLSISNTGTGPAGFVEDLNASFGTATGTGASLIGGTGSISGLLAGATNTTSMTVSVNTSSVAAVNGSIPVNFFTAGAVNGVSNGLGTAAVGSAAFGVIGTIQANGQVVDQAQPVINNPVINLGNVRVGDPSPTQFVSVTNQATGNPQAALNASISASPPITASGSFNLLAPGGTNNTSLQVGMVTTTAGAISGMATVAFVSDASNIGNCAPNCQLTLASQNVNVTGKVYTPAQAAATPTSVNFGIVHVGDAVAAVPVSMQNTAAVTALNDTLTGGFGVVSTPFTGNGTLGAGVAAQATDSTSLSVGLGTTSAGVFTGTAAWDLQSHNADLPDIPVELLALDLSATVNNYALADLDQDGGSGSLVQNGTAYRLEFGTLILGGSMATALLSLDNDVPAPADFLDGSWAMNSGSGFSLTGFGPVLNLGPGGRVTGLTVAFDPAALGSFNEMWTFTWFGHNPAPFRGADTTLTLDIQANVIPEGTSVPAPSTLVLLALGAALAGAIRLRRPGR